MTIQGPWQMEATGFPSSKNALVNVTAAGSMRRVSGFITPPGSRSASNSWGRAWSSFRFTG
jgi:hypothetical protein